MRSSTLVPGTTFDIAYLAYERDAQKAVRDVRIENPYQCVTIPLPALRGPDGRTAYVFWAGQLLEIEYEGDGVFAPKAHIVPVDDL